MTLSYRLWLILLGLWNFRWLDPYQGFESWFSLAEQETTMRYDKLPHPDHFGNYWFGDKKDSSKPVILVHSKSNRQSHDEFFLSLGLEGIVFTKDNGIQTYGTAEEALSELRKKLRNK